MKINLYHISIPMKRSFTHAEARRDIAEGIILEINQNNLVGIGECVPRKYVTGETIDSVLTVIRQVNMDVIINQIDFSSLFTSVMSLRRLKIFEHNHGIFPLNAVCVIEMSLLDLIGKHFNCSVKEVIKNYLLPYDLRRNIDLRKYKTTQVMDFSLSPEEFIKKRAPFHYIKIKVGKSKEENIRKISFIRRAVGEEISISIDANMAWTFDETIEMARVLKPCNIDYYEEPLRKGDYIGYRNLRKQTGIKVLLDESLCNISDASSAIKNKACDAFNIRISKCGGIISSTNLIKLAHKNELSFQIGSQAAEIGPLIAAGRHLVGAINEDNYLTYEAGQPDRFFNGNYIIDSMPLVDRNTNLAKSVKGSGLGINLNNDFRKYIKQEFYWKDRQWCIA